MAWVIGNKPSENVGVMYCDLITDTPIQLTTTPQLVSTWSEIIPSVNVDISGGVVTWGKGGVTHLSLERVYQNNDQNPTNDSVYVTVDVRKNGVTIFTRTLPISSATNATEPAISAFTSNGMRILEADETFEVYVSARDGVSTEPQDTSLIFMRMVADLSHEA